MSPFVFQVLYPIWIGIAINMLFSAVDIACMGNNSPWTDTWRRQSRFLFGGAWVVLICWSVFNGIRS